MLRRTIPAYKKGWTHNPGRTRRGGKNLAWRPKIAQQTLNEYVPLNLEHPPRRPNAWHAAEFTRLGNTVWPKAVAFYNAGDNFEVTPEMMWRLFEKNHNEPFWTQSHNEQAVVHLMPKVEQQPSVYMPRVKQILDAHVARFGADHAILNAVMQATAFAKDFDGCKALLAEMKRSALVPNAQSYVNMMLAVRMCGLPRQTAEDYFKEGIATNALTAVMRLDTEFQMWWDQLERLGSFTSSSGHLSVKEEGAKPMPKNMWALWGWDRTERKFTTRAERIHTQAEALLGDSKQLFGTTLDNVRRQPWAKYQGLFPFDYSGPRWSRKQSDARLDDAPPAAHNRTRCDPAF